jgi:hypothetical protein
MSIKIQTFLIIFCAICLLVIGFLYNQWRNQVSETDRWKNNYSSEVGNSSIRQELTAKEFKNAFRRLDSIAETLDIKAKNITNVLQIKYRLKDTTIVKTKIYRDSSRLSHFSIIKPCYSIYGTIINDTVNTSLKYTDEIIPFLYKDFNHKFLFIKWGKYYTAKVYSNCMNDTVKVVKNIRIEKRKKDLYN